jgi:hypothetical protein
VRIEGEVTAVADLRAFLPRCLEVKDADGEWQPAVQSEQARRRRKAGLRRAAEAEADGGRVVLGAGVFVRIRRRSLHSLNMLEGMEGDVVAERSGRWRVRLVGEDAAEGDLPSFLPRCLEIQDGQGEWRPAMEPEHARRGRAAEAEAGSGRAAEQAQAEVKAEAEAGRGCGAEEAEARAAGRRRLFWVGAEAGAGYRRETEARAEAVAEAEAEAHLLSNEPNN